jgi:hypothetical protein
MKTVFVVTVDRWGNYGREDIIKIFATKQAADNFIFQVDSHKNDSWYVEEVGYEDA